MEYRSLGRTGVQISAQVSWCGSVPWHREGDKHIAIVILPQHTSQMG